MPRSADQVLGQGVEATLPHRAMLREPALGLVESPGLEPAGTHAARLDGLNQSCVTQYLQMLMDAGQRHAEGRCEVRDGRGASGQALDDCPPGRVTKRMKDFVYLHHRYLSIYLSIDQAIW